jgi:hypothetical protein
MGQAQDTMSRWSQAKGMSNDEVNENETSVLDTTFPLFDEITKYVHLPGWLSWLVELWALLQTIAVSLWVRNDLVWTADSQVAKVVFYIATWGPRTLAESDIRTTVLIVTGLVALSLVMLVFQLLCYAHRREFLRATLYPTRILLSLAPSIVMGPLSMVTGVVMTRGEGAVEAAITRSGRLVCCSTSSMRVCGIWYRCSWMGLHI